MAISKTELLCAYQSMIDGGVVKEHVLDLVDKHIEALSACPVSENLTASERDEAIQMLRDFSVSLKD